MPRSPFKQKTCLCQNLKCQKIFLIDARDRFSKRSLYCSDECREDADRVTQVVRTCMCGCGRRFLVTLNNVKRNFYDSSCALKWDLARAVRRQRYTDAKPKDQMLMTEEDVPTQIKKEIVEPVPIQEEVVEVVQVEEPVVETVEIVQPEEPMVEVVEVQEQPAVEIQVVEPEPTVVPVTKKPRVLKHEQRMYERINLYSKELEGVSDDFGCHFDPTEKVHPSLWSY